MILPTIKDIGITQQRSATIWKATECVDGIGWLEAHGSSLTRAMEALQALAAQQVAEQAQMEHMWTEDITMVAAEAFEVVDNK